MGTMTDLERHAFDLAWTIVTCRDFVSIQPDGRPLLDVPAIEPLIARALQSYGAAQANAQKERDAAYLERRATEIEDGQDVAAWVARIFRDEAQAIRELDAP